MTITFGDLNITAADPNALKRFITGVYTGVYTGEHKVNGPYINSLRILPRNWACLSDTCSSIASAATVI